MKATHFAKLTVWTFNEMRAEPEVDSRLGSFDSFDSCASCVKRAANCQNGKSQAAG